MLNAHGWATDPWTGIFVRAGLLPSRASDPDLFVWAGSLPAWGPRTEELPVGGAGWDEEAAASAGVGEGFERLLPCPLPGEGAVESSHDEWALDEPAVRPDRWVLFHPEQYRLEGFPFEPFTARTVCRWVAFRRFPGGEPWWVPEELAFLYPSPGAAHRIGPSLSTGLSAGRLGQPVLARGVQEAIERDAATGAWWGRYPLELHPAERVLDLLGEPIARRARRPHLRYRFYRVRTPFSSHATIVTVEGEDREGLCLGVGAACRETRRSSWEKSLVEAIHGWSYARYRKGLVLAGEAPDPDVPSNFAEHAVWYSLRPERLAGTALARATPEAVDPDPDRPEGLADLVRALGPDRPVLFRNLTPPDVAEGDPPWYVLRVLVPGLQPLHGHHALPFLGGPLWAPRGVGEYAGVPPHPFP